MEHIPEKYMKEFVTACHRIASYGLVRCSSGNLSYRADNKHILITATQAWMAEITKEQIAVCRITDGFVLNHKKPSAESGFHLGILRKRPDINVVLHFQSPFSTAFACRVQGAYNFFVIPEIPYYIGQIAMVPYMNPGSHELAQDVATALSDHDLIVIQNHGQVTVGKDFDDVIQKACFFELACEIILKAGDKIQTLSEEAIAFLCPAEKEKGRRTI